MLVFNYLQGTPGGPVRHAGKPGVGKGQAGQ